MGIKDWLKKRKEKVYGEGLHGSAKAVADVLPDGSVAEKPAEKPDMKENVLPGLHPPPPEAPPPPVLDERDYKKLSNNRYEDAKGKFKTVFVIQHVKTGKVAELKAASSIHAAKMLGWRPRQTKLIKSYEEK